MGNIKLFRLSEVALEELTDHSVSVKKSLQHIIEQHWDTFLNVRFLATEYSTGQHHEGIQLII